jgi:hypothetical protein
MHIKYSTYIKGKSPGDIWEHRGRIFGPKKEEVWE